MKKLRILIANGHKLMRRDAKAVLDSQSGWSVVSEEVNGTDAVEKVRELKPDVAVVDIDLPELDGIEVARQIRETEPHTKILMLAVNESDQMIRWAMEAGATGYLLKSDLTDCLVEAVKAVLEGKRFLSPKVSEIVLEGFLKTRNQHPQGERPVTRLSPREIEIIRLLAEGKANKETAAELGITVRTVETHRAKIMLKLNLHSLAELIHYAVRHGMASV